MAVPRHPAAAPAAGAPTRAVRVGGSGLEAPLNPPVALLLLDPPPNSAPAAATREAGAETGVSAASGALAGLPFAAAWLASAARNAASSGDPPFVAPPPRPSS
jgi:hypothetical protein